MWIFTSRGFISAVAHRDKPGHLMIRARRMGHLHALFPGEEITQTSNADYRYRITVPRVALMQMMEDQLQALTYDNFKNSIDDHAYHDACTEVWTAMHRLQPGSYMPPADDDGNAWLEDEEPKRCPSCRIELMPWETACPDCIAPDGTIPS